MSRKISLTLTITAPEGLTRSYIRREVLTRINQLCEVGGSETYDLPARAFNRRGELKIKASVARKGGPA